MKLFFPKLFAHVAVEGLEAWTRGIRKEVADESFCPPVSPVVVGAEIKEDKIDPDKLEAFPASFPSFSPPLGPALGPRQTPVSACIPLFLSLRLKALPQTRFIRQTCVLLTHIMSGYIILSKRFCLNQRGS